jgi:hypothetical protein
MAQSKGYNNRAYVSNAPGAFAIILGSDFGTVQAALPTVDAGDTVTYFAHVPNTGSQWKVQKTVQYQLDGAAGSTPGTSVPGAIADPNGVVLSKISCIQPIYPGLATVVATGAVIVLNGYAFKATTGGTTAAAFIGFSKFNTTNGATTTDGSVVWTCYGKAAWLAFTFGNLSSVNAAPAAQDYALFQD